jgi:hypothetical protein
LGSAQVVEETNVETDSLTILKTFEHQLSLMAKQIRMLAELADAAPVVQRKRKSEEFTRKPNL